MRGITATGVYVPRFRLDADEISAAWDTGPGIDRKAVAAADEDALTMAVAAAEDALDDFDGSLTYLGVATTTPPVEEEEFAPRLGRMLGLNASARSETMTQSTAVGADVIRSAATADGPALAVVADCPRGDPGGDGQAFGAGAAAFRFEAEGSVELVADATYGVDAPGIRLRERGSDEVDSLGITTYERTTARTVISTAVDGLGVDISEVVAAAVHQPNGKLPYRIARGVDVNGEAVHRGLVADRLGDAGAATVPVGVLSAVESAAAGDQVLAASFGSGARAVALLFDVHEPLGTGVDEALSGGEPISYTRYLRTSGAFGEATITGGGAHVSLPSWQRTLDQRYRLVAGRCPVCNALAFPPEGACPSCHERVDFEPVALPRTGTVDAVTVIGANGAPPEFGDAVRRGGDFGVLIVSFEVDGERVRFPAQLTDCDPHGVEIGDEVTAQLRRLYEEEGVVRYTTKFTPVEGPT